MLGGIESTTVNKEKQTNRRQIYRASFFKLSQVNIQNLKTNCGSHFGISKNSNQVNFTMQGQQVSFCLVQFMRQVA